MNKFSTFLFLTFAALSFNAHAEVRDFTGTLSVGSDFAVLQTNDEALDVSIQLKGADTANFSELFAKCNDGKQCLVKADVTRDANMSGDGEGYWLQRVISVEEIK